MTTYHNPTTNQTSQVKSNKADKDGNVWVQIDGGMPQMVNWDEFLKAFNSLAGNVNNQEIGVIDEKI